MGLDNIIGLYDRNWWKRGIAFWKVNIALPAELQPLQYRLLVVEACCIIRSGCVSRLQNILGYTSGHSWGGLLYDS